MRNAETNELIEGLRMIFIELPKFEQENGRGVSMRVLWLRFLTEVGDSRQGIPEELEKNPEINRAMSMLLEDEFSENELLAYDYFWDRIGAHRLLLLGAFRKGHEAGQQVAAREEGCRIERVKNARAMKSKGFQPDIISEITGLPISEIAGL